MSQSLNFEPTDQGKENRFVPVLAEAIMTEDTAALAAWRSRYHDEAFIAVDVPHEGRQTLMHPAHFAIVLGHAGVELYDTGGQQPSEARAPYPLHITPEVAARLVHIEFVSHEPWTEE